jgi:hypothetical protein
MTARRVVSVGNRGSLGLGRPAEVLGRVRLDGVSAKRHRCRCVRKCWWERSPLRGVAMLELRPASTPYGLNIRPSHTRYTDRGEAR